jgi:RNA polymerase sigma factor (sigma-70 family)
MTWTTTTQILEDLQSPNGETAWQRLHDNFYTVIINFARHLGLSAVDAEDAAQETMLTFMEAFRKGKYHREQGHLSHWLFGVARRTIYNYRKKRPPEKQIASLEAETSFWEKVPDEQAEQHTWTAEWQQMVLQKCMERARRELQPQTFRAFELYALAKQPVEQVAQRLEMTSNAIYVAKNRVLSRLRELEKEFEDTA